MTPTFCFHGKVIISIIDQLLFFAGNVAVDFPIASLSTEGLLWRASEIFRVVLRRNERYMRCMINYSLASLSTQHHKIGGGEYFVSFSLAATVNFQCRLSMTGPLEVLRRWKSAQGRRRLTTFMAVRNSWYKRTSNAFDQPTSVDLLREMWSFNLVGLASILLASKAMAVTVTVSATASHPVPTTLCESNQISWLRGRILTMNSWPDVWSKDAFDHEQAKAEFVCLLFQPRTSV